MSHGRQIKEKGRTFDELNVEPGMKMVTLSARFKVADLKGGMSSLLTVSERRRDGDCAGLNVGRVGEVLSPRSVPSSAAESVVRGLGSRPRPIFSPLSENIEEWRDKLVPRTKEGVRAGAGEALGMNGER